MTNIEFLQKQIEFHSAERDKAGEDGNFKKFSFHDAEVSNYQIMLKEYTEPAK